MHTLLPGRQQQRCGRGCLQFFLLEGEDIVTCYSIWKGSATFRCWAGLGARGGWLASEWGFFCWGAPLTFIFASGDTSCLTLCVAGACICCCDGTSAATGVAASATASDRRECLTVRSSSNRRSCLAFLAAAPARPAATFFLSFGLALGEATTGTGARAVTLSTGTSGPVDSVIVALCASVVWSPSILIYVIHTMGTMSKSAVP